MHIRNLVPISGFCLLISVPPVAAHWTGPVPGNSPSTGVRPNAAPDQKWWDGLASGKGLCCSFADGVSIKDVDWDTGGPHGSYRVRLDGQWILVPPEAVVTEPNKFGPAVVWPYQDASGATQIRCFLPGAGA